MIVIRQDKGRNYPQLLCDACQKPITNVKTAHIVWDDEKQDAKPLYAHAGPCHNKIEANHRLSWQPLTVHMVYLLDNIGMRQPMLQMARKHADRYSAMKAMPKAGQAHAANGRVILKRTGKAEGV